MGQRDRRLLRDPPQPAEKRSRRRCAAAWLQKGNLEKAFADCNAVLRLDPNSPSPTAPGGAYWSKRGEWEKAVADCSEAIKLDPKDSLSYCTRGSAYRQLDETDKAMADYNAALRIDPQFVAAYGFRAEVWLLKGEDGQGDCRLQRGPAAGPRFLFAFTPWPRPGS